MTQGRSNVLLTVVCAKESNPHVLATVRPGARGRHTVDFQSMQRDANLKRTAVPRVAELDGFEGWNLYCRACRKQHTLAEEQLRDAINRGIPRIALQTLGFAKDPIGVLTRRWGQR